MLSPFFLFLPLCVSIDATSLCADDLPQTMAQTVGRNSFAKRCSSASAATFLPEDGTYISYIDSRAPWYDFGVCEQTDAAFVVCQSGGFLARQRLLTEQGWRRIDEIWLDNSAQAVAVFDSTQPLDATTLPLSGIERVVRRPYRGQTVVLTDDEGQELHVTAAQPVMLGNALLKRADTIAVGDVLMGDNSKRRIARVDHSPRDTFVYQVLPDRRDYDGNVHLVEGFYCGSERLLQERAAKP